MTNTEWTEEMQQILNMFEPHLSDEERAGLKDMIRYYRSRDAI